MAAGVFEDEGVDSPEVDWWPPLDIFECPEDFLLVLALPGVGPDDVEVVQTGRILSIEGIRRVELPEGASAHLLESPRGRFQRRLRLPANCDTGAISSSLTDGQLIVRVPKVERRAVRVPVTTEYSP
ncbi:MAG TPA: Hsp20/alpha crystallin family protein [Candidatus Sulfotelmatobacter sp.]|nr:Hsp20/alpha crystallin family protein [Candidatus Sulfotelmatobacter sp.]